MKMDNFAPGFVHNLRYFLKVTVVTSAFALSTTLTILVGLALLTRLEVFSYKIVTFFLLTITVSNILSRYAAWLLSEDSA